MLLINFKTYQNSTGAKAVELAKKADKVALETGAEIAVAVDAASINAVSDAVSIPVYAQHVDHVGFGANTGHLVAEVLREMGASGAIINHAEKKIDFSYITGSVARCRIAGLKSVVCVNTMEEAAEVLGLHPDYISLEHADLIGSGKSISSLRPNEVKYFSQFVRKNDSKTKPLCGAGISNGDDVKAALELGALGVMVASAIVNAKDQEKAIREMAEALVAR